MTVNMTKFLWSVKVAFSQHHMILVCVQWKNDIFPCGDYDLTSLLQHAKITKSCNIHSFLFNIPKETKTINTSKLLWFSCQGDHSVAQNTTNTSPTCSFCNFVNFDYRLDHLLEISLLPQNSFPTLMETMGFCHDPLDLLQKSPFWPHCWFFCKIMRTMSINLNRFYNLQF